MKYICLLFLSLIVNTGFSQSKKIWILDSLTHKPVNNVVMHTSKGDFYSNKQGIILLNKNIVGAVQLYRVGYVQKSLEYTASIDTIFMASKPVELNAVKVSGNKIHFFDVGYYNKHSSFIAGDVGNLNCLCIVAVYIPHTNKEIYISKILLKIKDKKYYKEPVVHLG